MNIYKMALLAQSAPNLGALINSLPKVVEEIRKEPEFNGSDYLNKHPVIVMFVTQLLWLSTGETMDVDKWNKANDICEAKQGEG